jgi:Zn-dependent oligopeptidase
MNISFSNKRLPVAAVIVTVLVIFIVADLNLTTPERVIDAHPPQVSSEFARLVNFRDAARAAGVVFTLPEWPQTTLHVHQSVDDAIEKSNQLLDEISLIKPYLASFKNTVQAYETAVYPASDAFGVINMIAEVHPDMRMRAEAREANKRYSSWAVSVGFRDDIYQVIKSYAETEPPLGGEDEKLLNNTMRNYRRNGMDLSQGERDELKRLKTELKIYEIEFDRNINEADLYLEFSANELIGVPVEMLSDDTIRTEGGTYRINANVSWQREAILKNAVNAASRRRVASARFQRAVESNMPLVTKMLIHRGRIAKLLGYDSWADYRTETRMAKNASTALDFQEQLKDGLETKFRTELAVLRDLKAEETCDVDARIKYWDVAYYENQLKRSHYSIDAEQLRVYFEMNQTLDGMFNIFAELFGIKITRIEPSYRWVDDLRLYVVRDSDSSTPLGLLYMDLFPREGKYNHFAHFEITPGKRLRDGRMQRPVGALIGNFPPATADKPSLLSLEEVETLFHEFGHALHDILSMASYASLSGTSVPGDFVEAPSQMLEFWVRDKTVLDRFAADYRDPQKKIPADVLAALQEARLATVASFERSQLAYSLIDTRLHMLGKPGKKRDLAKFTNRIAADVYLSYPEDTAMLASFGHLTGYDAGYYGYAWSRAISEDMASVFRASPDGFMDKALGRRLRDEIYAPGSSRDVEYSIEAFLGRERSMQPFFDSIGITDTQ